MSSLLSNEIDILDREILFLITKGNPSSYSVWAAMNKQMQGRGLAYVNVKKRIRRMVEMDILQRVEPGIGTTSVRGRKEHKVTQKGMEYLIHYLLSQSEDFEPISKYIYKSGLDRKAFEKSLNHRIYNILISVNSYYEVAGQIAIFPSKHITNILIEDIKEPKQVTITRQQTTTLREKRNTNRVH